MSVSDNSAEARRPVPRLHSKLLTHVPSALGEMPPMCPPISPDGGIPWRTIADSYIASAKGEIKNPEEFGLFRIRNWSRRQEPKSPMVMAMNLQMCPQMCPQHA